MTADSVFWRIAAGCAGLCCLAVLVRLGPAPAAGSLAGGALLATWGFVYAHILCAGKQLQSQKMGRAAAWGAGFGPIVVLLCTSFGAIVTVPLLLCVAWWVGAVTPSGHLPGVTHRAAVWLKLRSDSESPN